MNNYELMEEAKCELIEKIYEKINKNKEDGVPGCTTLAHGNHSSGHPHSSRGRHASHHSHSNRAG